MTLLFASGGSTCAADVAAILVRKTTVRDGVIGDLPLALILDKRLSDPAKIVAALLWSQSYVLGDGRRVVAWKVEHVAEVIGCSFKTASVHVRSLRDAGYVARIAIPVPELDQSVRGYWLGPNVREAVRTRNARARAAKVPGCPETGRSSAAPPLVASEPGLATAPLASPAHEVVLSLGPGGMSLGCSPTCKACEAP